MKGIQVMISKRNADVFECKLKPASVAQLNARPTGDQEVAGSTSTESATFFRGD